MADKTDTQADAEGEQLSYEAAREELVDTVRRLEAGGTTLEESLALWERGEHLATVCQQWLDGVRERAWTTASRPRSRRRAKLRGNQRSVVHGQQRDQQLLVVAAGGAVDQQGLPQRARRTFVDVVE